MAIRFRCEHCSGLMSISSRKAGARVQCATCGQQTLVPLEDIFDAPAAVVEPVEALAPKSPPDEGGQPNLESMVGPDARDWPIRVPADAESEVAPAAETFTREAVSPDDEVDTADAAAREAADDDEVEAPPLVLRRRTRTDDEMDLTPMVDVTFQLLIFFMVTASFALQKTIQVPTPDPDQQGATQQMQTLDDLQGTSILVKIDAGNGILIDDEPLANPAQLADVLRDKMRKEQKTELLLTSHPAALHRGVITVIDAANEVGMQKIRLASRKGKDD